MKRLVLKQHDKKIAGLCAGIAAYIDVDVTVVRLIVLTAIIMTGVVPGLLVYLIAAAITPREEKQNNMPKRNRPFIALRSEEDPTTVYTTSKNPKNTTERIVARKYSKLLRKVVEFKEAK